jgi:hypothetical protein
MELINTSEEVYQYVSNLIESSRFKFNYKIVDETYLDIIVDFINQNYSNRNKIFSMIYTKELIKYYLIDSLPILFYAKDKIIALIIGKYINLMSFDKNIETLDGNFMCIIPQLRNLHLPKIIIAYLVREGIKRNTINIKMGYYTTSYKINNEPMCLKNFKHRPINYNELVKLEILDKTDETFKNLCTKFVYPNNFNNYKISEEINENKINEIVDKINLYQKEHFNIYESVSSNTIINIINYNSIVKFVIYNNINNSIVAFFSFYRVDILNKKINKPIRILNLYYYYCDRNIEDYLEYVGEYMKNNNMCDMFRTTLNINSSRYYESNGELYYHLWNVKPFTIDETKVNLIII